MKRMSTGAVLLIGAGLLFLGLVKSASASTNESALTPLAESMADKYGLSRALVKAIIKWETRGDPWNPNSTNPNDPSYGLMAVTPYIAIHYGVCRPGDDYETELHKPEKSLEAGCAYLSELWAKHDDGTAEGFKKIIECYNEGEPNYDAGYRVDDYYNGVEAFYEEYLASS